MIMELFEKPIEKRLKDLEVGDVILVEYGDYENYIKVAFEGYEINGSWLTLKGQQLYPTHKFGEYNGEEWQGHSIYSHYKSADYREKVVGKIIK